MKFAGASHPEGQLSVWEAVILRYRGRPESLSVSEIRDGQRRHGAGTGWQAGEADPERPMPLQYRALDANVHFLIDLNRPAAENHTVTERLWVSGRTPAVCTQIHVLPLDIGVKGEWTQTAVSTCA